jgi:hypothetical protein
MIIPFGEYAPDNPALGNMGATVAKNVTPQVVGYGKLNSLTAYSSALTSYCRGAFTAVDSDGSIRSFAGDETKLYRLIGSTFTDSSKVGGYTNATDSYWEFAQFGNNIVASNFDSAPQTMELTGTTFSDLSGTPPMFRHVGVVRDFMVVGNTFDAVDGNVPYRIRWPGIGTITSWTVSSTTQADYQDLQGNGGWVQSVVGGREIGHIFQERAIWQMRYVGSPVVFDIAQVEDARGAFAPRSTISAGGIIFYLADDGFYALAGGQSVPIGAGKVDKTFLSDLNDSYLHRVTAAAIPNDKIIIWSYPGSGSVDGTPDKCLLYNWVSKKWCFAEFNHELIYRAQTVGMTLDGLDALGYTMETLPFSLDSKVWMGGKLQLAAFNTEHKQSFLTGTALDATLETGEVQLSPGRRSEVGEVVPLVDGGTHTVQVGTRETQTETVSFGSISAENASGVCPVRSNSRYHRFRVNNTGDFNSATGVLVPDEKIVSVGER